MAGVSSRRQRAIGLVGKGHNATNFVLVRAEALTRRWIHGLKEQYHEAYGLSCDVLAGNVKPADWIAEVAALYINGTARMLGCGTDVGLDFDSAAEMAGPLSISVKDTIVGTPNPSDLVLENPPPSAAAGTIPHIPRGHVKVRYSVGDAGTTIVVTLIDLLAVQSTLVPGVYTGTIGLGGSLVVPIQAKRF